MSSTHTDEIQGSVGPSGQEVSPTVASTGTATGTATVAAAATNTSSASSAPPATADAATDTPHPTASSGSMTEDLAPPRTGATELAKTITFLMTTGMIILGIVLFFLAIYFQWWWGVGMLTFLSFVAMGPMLLPGVKPPPNENPYHSHAKWVRVAIPAVLAFFAGRYYAYGVIQTGAPQLKFFLPPPADRQCSLPLDLEV